ncbi:MAG: Hpt domain-containing protein [Thermoanaerobaculia bacterium]
MGTPLPADELEGIRRDYLEDMKRTAANVRSHAIALGDGKRFKTSFPVLLYSAHQIKGSGGMLGYPELSEIGSKMAVVLGSFLEETEPRPTARSLSTSIQELSNELDEALARASA